MSAATNGKSRGAYRQPDSDPYSKGSGRAPYKRHMQSAPRYLCANLIPEEAEKLQALAYILGSPISAIMRMAMDLMFAKYAKEIEIVSRARKEVAIPQLYEPRDDDTHIQALEAALDAYKRVLRGNKRGRR